MEGRTRIVWILLAVLVAVAVPLVVLALASGGGDEESDEPETASIKVERAPPGFPEIIVYVEDPALNTAETAGGDARVTVECLDTADAVVYSRAYAWPFTDTDDGLLDPHAHLEMDPVQIERVTRCRLRGTTPRLEGRLL